MPQFEQPMLEKDINFATLPGYASFRKEIQIIEESSSLPPQDKVMDYYNQIPEELRQLALRDAKEGYSINRAANSGEISFIKAIDKSDEDIEINDEFRSYLQHLAWISKLYQKEFAITFFNNSGSISVSITVGSHNFVNAATSEALEELGTIHTHPTKTDFGDNHSMERDRDQWVGDLSSYYYDHHRFDCILTDKGHLSILKGVGNIDSESFGVKVLLIVQYLLHPSQFVHDIQQANSLERLKQQKDKLIQKAARPSEWLSIIKSIKEKYGQWGKLPKYLSKTIYIDDLIATLLGKRSYRCNIYKATPAYKAEAEICGYDVTL